MSDQKPMWTRCPGGFSVMWVTQLLISPGKIRIFCPKLAILFILVGGWGARAVSRKTPIYFIIGLLRSTSMYGIYARILNNRLNTEVELQPSINVHVAKWIFTTNKVSVVQEQKKSINGITILVIFSFVWFGRGQEITSWETHVRNMTAPHINFVISI